MRRRHRQTAIAGLAVALVAGCSSSAAQLTTHHLGPALSGVGQLPAAASAWPQAGYDARYSSATAAVGPQSGHVRWKLDLHGNGTPGPVLAANGDVLAATNAGVLSDVDASTGTVRWRFDGHGSYGSDLSTSPAVLPGGTILWPGPNNTLYAVSATGHELWTVRFGGQVLSPAVGGRHRVYVADMTGRLSALLVTPTSHRVVWTVHCGGTDYASPTIGQNGNVYTADDHDLVAVRDLGNRGGVLWRFHARKMVEVSNAVAPDGTVVLGTNHDHEFGISPAGKVRWARQIGDYTYSSAVVRPDGTAYFGDNMGRLHVLHTATGAVTRVITPLGAGKEKIWTSAAVDARGDIYWATTAGNVYGYTSTGRQLFALALGAGVNSYPAIGADGTLYLATTAGLLYAIGPAA